MSGNKERRDIDYTDFKLGVTVWSLERSEDRTCDELLAICSLLGSPDLTESPVDLYPRVEPILLLEKTDPRTFLSIELAQEPTDQMEMVGLSIRCQIDVADAIHELLQSIRQRSEVKTALLRGNLGLTSPSIE